MESLSIALICAVSFGAVVAFSAFIRQLLLSRDKRLNDEAQHRALSYEAEALEKIRTEMKENKNRFSAHYQVLGSNKEAIKYLDQKINEILIKKAQMIHRYAKLTLTESAAIIDGKRPHDNQDKCDKLCLEINAEIESFQKEIEHYQERRNALWDTHREFLDSLLEQEKSQNENLDALYQKHSAMLQKIIFRHNDSADKLATQTINAGTNSFMAMIKAPILFLMQYFGLAKGVSLDKLSEEISARTQVADSENDINEGLSDSEGDYDSLDKEENLNHACASDKELSWS